MEKIVYDGAKKVSPEDSATQADIYIIGATQADIYFKPPHEINKTGPQRRETGGREGSRGPDGAIMDNRGEYGDRSRGS